MKNNILWGLLVCYSTFGMASIDKKTTIERYALIAASNNGGDGRVQLQYAESDALAMSKVFREIGGVSSSNSTILLSPSKKQIEDSLQGIRHRMKTETTSDQRAEFIFYYSGHSDETGLLLKDGKYLYKDLRAEITNVSADIKIAILDSCQSGAFTRLKGGIRTAPFILNSANQITGSVFLAASSASEASQESDVIGGSFFTHYFVSALRGAADISGDKQITLNEAYLYAYNETLAQTEASLVGAQHPEYNIQIAGAGDIILTDINTSSSTLTVPRDIIGRLYIRDANGALVIELNKVSNKEIGIALDPNQYSLVLEKNPEVYRSKLKLQAGEKLTMRMTDFKLTTKKSYVAKGLGSALPAHAKQGIREKRSNRVAVGFMAAHLNLPEPSRGPPEIPRVDLDYSGYTISYFRDISDVMSWGVEFYEMKGNGVMRGYSMGLKRYIKLWQDRDFNVYFYLGISPFIEKLTDMPEEYVVLSTWVERNINTNKYGVYFPFGINLGSINQSISVNMFTRVKLVGGYTDYYASPSDFFSGTGINFGYEF